MGRNFSKSRALFQRAIKSLSGGVNSPVRAFKAVGGSPLYIERGEGAYLFDVDGNRYLDFCGSWGPLILGHAHPVVLEAIQKASERGASFGAVHEGEILLAEKVKKLCPHLELLRFVSSGTEAVMSAIRLARAFTKRNKIVKFSGCYHGHSDYLLASAGSGLVTFGIPASAGVPEDFTRHTLVAPLDDEQVVRDFFRKFPDDIAAIIIEPVPANDGLLLQRRGFLQFLREITAVNGSLLVLDEVISGFRVRPGGAAEYYDIKPDLATYGKIIGGGLPVGAFGGRADIMQLLAPLGPVYQAGTLSGNPLAMATGLATLEYLERTDGWSILESITGTFVKLLNDETSDCAVNIPSLGSLFWINLQKEPVRRAEDISKDNAERYKGLFSRALEAGIYLAPSAYEVGFISTAHSREDLKSAARSLGEIIRSL